MTDLQDLFSRLKATAASDSSSSLPQAQTQTPPRSSSSLWAQPAAHQSQSVSSPLLSPPSVTHIPTRSPDIVSPIPSASMAASPAPDLRTTNNLLSLLNINQPSSQLPHASNQPGRLHDLLTPKTASVHINSGNGTSRDATAARQLSAADLMASLQRNSQTPASSLVGTSERLKENLVMPAAHQQNFLLNLLQSKDQPPLKELPASSAPAAHALSQHQMGKPATNSGGRAAEAVSFESPQPTKPTIFNYRNPFDELHSSSPLKAMQGSQDEPTSSQSATTFLYQNADTPTSASMPLQENEVKGTDAVNGSQDSAKVADGSPPPAEDVEEGKATRTSTKAKDAAPPQDDIGSSWESAEDDETPDFKVDVYNFPMRPFVSLQIKNLPTARPIRQENAMVIAQLKKDFDQIDRCLVTASQTHIIYAQVATKKDNGGFRVLRQDNGQHKMVFRSSGERVFSVQHCTSSNKVDDVESALATGVNGTVFWVPLQKSRGDQFEDDDVEAQGFCMPPVATAEENTSGSPVKTRAKTSSRHPEFFGMARGKQIYLIMPEIAKRYREPSSRKIDSEKYFAEQTLKINTGKAGKDFAFSEDDSVIVSLDKNGRIKFWDISELISQAKNSRKASHEPIELNEPVWVLNAAASGTRPEEKSSVSSIMFLDKDRPTQKGCALRYMIVGFKQNHILQLWDLGLGKAVQEICLPHAKDSDGICSISYHAKSGIIAVGHPTRNSVYFIHLSAPKYTLQVMDQAKYINLLAHGNPALPRPESTAIMSGLREFSLDKIGQLRSVDMLKTPVETASGGGTPEETLFELYVMHSKGVIAIPITREDLGWDAAGKVQDAKDALSEGVIEVRDLVQLPKPQSAADPTSVSEVGTKNATKVVMKREEAEKPSDAARPVSRNVKAEDRKDTTSIASAANPSKRPEAAPQLPPKSSVDTVAAADQAKDLSNGLRNQVPLTGTPQRNISPSKDARVPSSANVAKRTTSAQPTAPVSSVVEPIELQSLLSKQFEALYQRIDAERRAQDASAGAKQEALLRLVSTTLTENVDRSLHHIVSTTIQNEVLPYLTDNIGSMIDRKIAELMPLQLTSSVQAAMKANLFNALQHAVKDKEFHQHISEITANQVANKVQQQVSAMLQQSLPTMASQATQKMVSGLERQVEQKLSQLQAQRLQDNAKIEELTALVQRMSESIEKLTEMQVTSHEALQSLQRDSTQPQTRMNTPPPQDSSSDSREQLKGGLDELEEDLEVADITRALMEGNYDDATIKWISSDRQADIFDKLFVRVNMDILDQVSPLVSLTVSAAITSSFATNVDKRLEWLGKVLGSIDINHADIRDVVPRIMDVLSQRLNGAFLMLSEIHPEGAAILRTIAHLSHQVSEIRRLTA